MGNKCCASCLSSKDENTLNISVLSSKDENTLDISVLSEVVKDTSDIEELISFIQQRLDILTDNNSSSQQDPSTSPGNAGTSQEPVVASKMKSCVKFGRDLLDNVEKRVQRDTSESPFRVKLGDKTSKLIIDMLKESVKIHWLGVGLSVLGYVLEQIGQDFQNKEQCVKLLRYMLALAEHVRQLDEKLSGNTEKLNDVIKFIVRGCVMCVSQMTNQSLFRFISASLNADDIKNFESELGQKYHDLTLEAIMALPHFLRPTQGENPNAVGIIDAQKTVTDLLQVEVKDQTKRAVVIYGFGGVGKTTLATAVFHHLHLKDNNYKFCRLDMKESCSSDDIKGLQQQLFLDLFEKNIKLRSDVEGRYELTKEFSRARTQSVSVFMFIDNALKNEDLAKLLPSDLSCLPDQTRILLTTRNLEESSMFLQVDIQRDGYKVDCLKSKESKEFLFKKALHSVDDTFRQGVDIDGLVKICGGIPLVLEIVGSRLSQHYTNISRCNEIIEELKESLKEGEAENISGRVVDVVYNSLEDNFKEAFLDIACFFHNQERSFVSYVVGDVSLTTLENAALVKISHDPPTSKSSMRSARSAYSRWFEFVNGREVF